MSVHNPVVPLAHALRAWVPCFGVVAIAVVLSSAVAAGPLSAQEIAGDVVDDTRTPVPSVRITILDRRGAPVAEATSDSVGFFRVALPGPGSYDMRASRPGYRSLHAGPYHIEPRTTVSVLIMLHRQTLEIEGMVVEVQGRSPRLHASGFYERRRLGFGHFVDREELLSRATGSLASYLARLPSLERGNRAAAFGPQSVRNVPLVAERNGRPCVPALWIDGSLVRSGGSLADPLRPDDWVGVGEVEGIEFYQGPSTVPTEFARSSGCAVLVVWTRDPRLGGG